VVKVIMIFFQILLV